MQHRIAFTTVQAEPGKPVLPAQQVNDGQKGALREEYSVWGLWDWLHFKAIVAAAAGNPSMRQSLANSASCHCLRLCSALLCGTNHVRNCNCNENWVLAAARTVGCVCVSVCAIYLWQHQTPLTCGTQSPAPSLTLGIISSAPLGDIEFSWLFSIGYVTPDLKLCLKAIEIIYAYKSL